jgi:hypothetical protein
MDRVKPDSVRQLLICDVRRMSDEPTRTSDGSQSLETVSPYRPTSKSCKPSKQQRRSSPAAEKKRLKGRMRFALSQWIQAH